MFKILYDVYQRPFYRLLWIELWNRCNEDSEVTVTQSSLAELFQVNHNTIWYGIRSLTQAGYLRRIRKYEPNMDRRVQTYCVINK